MFIQLPPETLAKMESITKALKALQAAGLKLPNIGNLLKERHS